MSRHRQIEADIDALRQAASDLRAAGAEILSARVVCDGQPEIHLFSAPNFDASRASYVKSDSGGYTHRAMQYLGCELVWITPIPMPGQPRQFSPINDARTSHHG